MGVIPTLICGVDWSGAQDAGARVWISKGRCEGKLYLVEDLFRADESRRSDNVYRDDLCSCTPGIS